MTEIGSAPLCFSVPDGQATAEYSVKRSVFIGTVGPARDAREAQAFIAGVRSQYPDADHHAWAYRLTQWPQGEVGSSDDGEPGGTAGRPMLAVLEGRGLACTVAVGTRYFGGIKLGPGGLVRAYSECIRLALEKLPLARMVYHYRAVLSVDYALYGALKYTLPRQGVLIEDAEFGQEVNVTVLIPPDALVGVRRFLSETTDGRIDVDAHLVGGAYVKIGQ